MVALALAACVAFSAPSTAAAHPHVFVDNAVAFEFNADGLAGIRVNWLFDDMFGTMIREDFDADGDGTFSKAEVAAVKKGAFSNLKHFDYFTFILIDGTPYKVTRVEQFDTGFKSGQLFYEFFVPCPVPAKGGAHTIRLRVHDPEYYADVYTPEESVPALKDAQGFNAKATVKLNPDETYSTFQVWSTDINLTFSSK